MTNPLDAAQQALAECCSDTMREDLSLPQMRGACGDNLLQGMDQHLAQLGRR